MLVATYRFDLQMDEALEGYDDINIINSKIEVKVYRAGKEVKTQPCGCKRTIKRYRWETMDLAHKVRIHGTTEMSCITAGLLGLDAAIEALVKYKRGNL
jgi:hypothetical protein